MIKTVIVVVCRSRPGLIRLISNLTPQCRDTILPSKPLCHSHGMALFWGRDEGEFFFPTVSCFLEATHDNTHSLVRVHTAQHPAQHPAQQISTRHRHGRSYCGWIHTVCNDDPTTCESAKAPLATSNVDSRPNGSSRLSWKIATVPRPGSSRASHRDVSDGK